MSPKKYFEKTGKIFGVSSKFEFGWHHSVHIFDNWDEAIHWLHKEQYDFRERELMSKVAAINLAGKSAIDNALNY